MRQLQPPLLARLVDDVQPLDHAVGLPRLGGLLLAGLGPELASDLVVVPRLAAGVRDALLHPGPLRPGPRLQLAAAIGVVVVRLPRLPPCDRALVEVGVVPAAVDRDPLQAAVDLDDGGDRAREELAVVAHDDEPRLRPRRRTPRAGRARRCRGRWSARRAGRGRSARAAAPRARPGPPARRTAPSPGGRGRRSGPRSAATTGSRSSRSAPPSASQRLERVGVARRPTPAAAPSASAAASIAAVAAATPVRLASSSRTDSPARTSVSWSEVADVRVRGRDVDRARRRARGHRRGRAAASTCRRRSVRRDRRRHPGPTVRSSPEKSTRSPRLTERPRATRTALTSPRRYAYVGAAALSRPPR